jgi:hypothetical protein
MILQRPPRPNEQNHSAFSIDPPNPEIQTRHGIALLITRSDDGYFLDEPRLGNRLISDLNSRFDSLTVPIKVPASPDRTFRALTSLPFPAR